MNAEEKKLVGIWGSQFDGSVVYTFYEDGTFIGLKRLIGHDYGNKGNYSLKNGVLTMEYYYSYSATVGVWGVWKFETSKYEGDRGVKFSTINGKQAFTYGLYGKNNFWFIKDRVGLFSL